MSSVSERVRQLVTGMFGRGGEAEVIERLERIVDPFGYEVGERVQAAVVKSSHGDRELLEEQAVLAEVDWRDVLVAADLAHDDWDARIDEFLAGVRIERWDGPPVDAWEAWTPWEAADRLGDVDAAWCVVGGWAIDLALGEQTREHEDLEIAVLWDELPLVRRHLADYAFHAAGGGQIRRLGPDEATPESLHQHWVLDEAAGRWRVDVMAEPGDGDTWAYRRDPSFTAPRSEMVGVTADGIRYLRPHGVLFFKAKANRPKDRRDFDAAEPGLAPTQRAWLRDALGRFHPDHPWIGRLD